MFSSIIEILKFRRLIFYLAWGRIKQGERDRLLGRLWNLLDPLALLAVYYFVFNVVFESRIENFVLFLFSAIIAFRFFAQSLKQSSSVILSSRGLVGEAYFPKAVLPISVVLISAHDYVYSFITLILMTVVLGVDLSPLLLLWPAVFLVQLIFTLGFAVFAANIGVFLRDLQNILDICLRLLFYLSATMYDISRVPKSLQPYFRMNPIYVFYESYRNILLYNTWPQFAYLGLLLMASLVLLIVAVSVMSRRQGNYIKYL